MGSFDQALTMRLSTAILLIAQASQAWSLNETETTTSATTTTQTTTGYNQPCRIVLPGGEVTTHHKFEASDGTVHITIQGQTGCQLRTLLVGGGGAGGGYGGGGSGYFIIHQFQVNPSYKIFVTAGGHGSSRMISVNGITIIAHPGLDDHCDNGFCYGGDGYSGGGGYCWEEDGVICDTGNYTGGTNGSNGGGPSTPDDHHWAHGHGTGEDISGYRMDEFKLSPGQGGMAYVFGGYVFGGGGGGILVDGVGPTTDGYAGHGYGAGGGGGDAITGGLSGVVLIETVE